MSQILVIDDDDGILGLYSTLLHAAGYDVATALTGNDGVALFHREHFDLVLVDLRLPDVSGLEVLVEVQRGQPAPPVVVVTGWGTVPAEIAAKKLGALDFINKPLDPDELLRIVQRHLTKSLGGIRSSELSELPLGPASLRWASLVVSVTQFKTDVPTLTEWGRQVTSDSESVVRSRSGSRRRFPGFCARAARCNPECRSQV
jgi:two-component system phosphoglycerate transport system response regulator PgtA